MVVPPPKKKQPADTTHCASQVKWDHLHGALDRFAAFFTCPTFDASSTEREMNAVDSEHTNNLQDDVRRPFFSPFPSTVSCGAILFCVVSKGGVAGGSCPSYFLIGPNPTPVAQQGWRLFQLNKATAHPQHPYHKFGSGNLETLRPRPEQGLDTREVGGPMRWVVVSLVGGLGIGGAGGVDGWMDVSSVGGRMGMMARANSLTLTVDLTAPPLFDSRHVPSSSRR